MQPLISTLLRQTVRPLLVLSAVSTLSACGVSYSSSRPGETSSPGSSEAQASGLADVAGPPRVTVDNTDRGFRLYVEPGYHEFEREPDAWKRIPADGGGIGLDRLTVQTGYLDASPVASPNGRKVAAIALWEAALPTEQTEYTVYAFVIPSTENTDSASYCFSMGKTSDDQETQDCGLVDQSAGEPGWRQLTTLPLSGRAQVWLDPGATLDSGKRVVADAVMFVPASGS